MNSLPRFRLALLGLALLSWCVTRSTVHVARVESPLQAQLVVRAEKVHPCLRIDRFHCSYEKPILVIKSRNGERELPLGCPAPASAGQGQIATDDRGEERVAFRCSAQAAWKVVYLGAGERFFEGCRTYPSAGPAFDWNQVPGFLGAVEGMAVQNCGDFRALVAELEHRSGVAAVTALLIASFSAKTPIKGTVDNKQAWDDVFVALPPAEKARLEPHFRQALTSESNLLALERTLRHADLSDPSYVPAIKARLERIVAMPGHSETDTSVDVMLRLLARNAPHDAARLGCLEIERERKRGALMFLGGALLAVAHGRYPCPALLGTLASSNCDAEYFCSGSGATGRFCSQDEMAGDIESALNERGPLSFKLRERAMLAASLPLPQAQAVLESWKSKCSGL